MKQHLNNSPDITMLLSNIKDNHKKTALYVFLYASFALILDSISTAQLNWIINWGIFHWKLENGFEVSTFIFWFVIPFLFSVKSMDWAYFGVSRIKKNDIYFVLFVSVIGILGVLCIKIFPSLRESYPNIVFPDSSAKMDWALNIIVWNISWLTGWEFLHRYVLLTRFEKAYPNRGWFGVCLIEFIFHFQKAFLEAMGMFIFSIIVTRWAVKRKNVLIPFMLHMLVEFFLVILIIIE